MTQEEISQLSELLMGYHEVFSLEDEERGETNLVEFKIDTGDAIPNEKPSEIANQLGQWGY